MNNHHSCRQTCESAAGCRPVSKNLPSDIAVHIDMDREVARIHSLLFDKMSKIDELLEITSGGKGDIENENKRKSGNPFSPIDDYIALHSTLTELKSALTKLDADQKFFLQKEWHETVYGSEKAPIGDHSYLSMYEKHANLQRNESKIPGDQKAN